jgi:1,4-dihydroxy-2-naphthoyl-CoA synthase
LGRRAFTLLSDLPAGQALDAAQFLNVPFFLGRELAEGTDAFVSGRAPDWVSGSDG